MYLFDGEVHKEMLQTMKRLPWSISTTVRNPARLRDFLRVLSRFEGRFFDEDAQKDFQIALIQERLYKPQLIEEELKKKYEDFDSPLDWDTAKNIFESRHYEDPAMRGRQSVNPLNKLGLAVALRQLGEIRITPAGKKLLESEAAASDIIFRSLLKLQYPNPLNTDFSRRRGFNTVPMPAILRLLVALEKKDKKGLTQDEFCLFVPTWIDISDLDDSIARILSFAAANRQERKKLAIRWIIKFYDDNSLSEKNTRFKNLRGYCDNAMRYFRFTKYFRVVASPLGGWTIEIEPTRRREVEMLLEKFNGSPREHKNLKEYEDVVLDPFVGTGTTVVVAHRLGRRWIGIEKNSVYYEAALSRLCMIQASLVMETHYAYCSPDSR